VQLEIKKVSVEKLIPYVRNSRTHSDAQVAQIAASIKEFGWTNPILVDGENGIIAGHGRLLAARKLGHSEVPIIELSHMTESQKKAYVIADNQLAMNAGWDTAMLTLELADLKDAGFDLDIIGFDAKELDKLLEPEQVEGLTDEDAVPDAPEEPKTKLGDIYQLGNHRLMCGDSNDTLSIDKLLYGIVPNAIITDPPYGIGIDGQKHSISSNPKHNRKFHEKKGWDSERPDEGIFRWIVSMNVPSVIWGGNYFADLLPATRGWLYWSKGQDGLTMSDGELAWTTENKPLRSKTINRAALKGSIHPTQKPVEIIEFSIDYLKVPTNGAVLDLFAGSGTIAIACEKHQIKSYMMEQDAGYCDAIVKRWEDFTGKKAVLLTSN
jgi:DNA modification methylase